MGVQRSPSAREPPTGTCTPACGINGTVASSIMVSLKKRFSGWWVVSFDHDNLPKVVQAGPKGLSDRSGIGRCRKIVKLIVRHPANHDLWLASDLPEVAPTPPTDHWQMSKMTPITTKMGQAKGQQLIRQSQQTVQKYIDQLQTHLNKYQEDCAKRSNTTQNALKINCDAIHVCFNFKLKSCLTTLLILGKSGTWEDWDMGTCKFYTVGFCVMCSNSSSMLCSESRKESWEYENKKVWKHPLKNAYREVIESGLAGSASTAVIHIVTNKRIE